MIFVFCLMLLGVVIDSTQTPEVNDVTPYERLDHAAELVSKADATVDFVVKVMLSPLLSSIYATSIHTFDLLAATNELATNKLTATVFVAAVSVNSLTNVCVNGIAMVDPVGYTLIDHGVCCASGVTALSTG